MLTVTDKDGNTFSFWPKNVMSVVKRHTDKHTIIHLQTSVGGIQVEHPLETVVDAIQAACETKVPIRIKATGALEGKWPEGWRPLINP